MLTRRAHAIGLRGDHLHLVSLASVGLWPPTLWLVGDSLERWER